MTRNLVVTITVAVIMAGFVLAYTALTPVDSRAVMGGRSAAGVPQLPPVRGFAEGREIYFVHSEVSDPKIAKILTDMMQSPVLVVPALVAAPAELLANVYVFANGVKGDGPLGFQPDIFDDPPGMSGYRPLRSLNQVVWKDAGAARELKSAAELMDAEEKGELTIERPGVVVNMPMLTWPGGER